MVTAVTTDDRISDPRLSPEEHPVWAAAFDDHTRSEQLRDDSFAWRSVSGVLVTIVGIGVGLAILSVWLCL